MHLKFFVPELLNKDPELTAPLLLFHWRAGDTVYTTAEFRSRRTDGQSWLPFAREKRTYRRSQLIGRKGFAQDRHVPG